MNFISTCYQLGSELVSDVINRELYFEHTNSLIGRNAVYCSLRYGISLNHICVVIQKTLDVLSLLRPVVHDTSKTAKITWFILVLHWAMDVI